MNKSPYRLFLFVVPIIAIAGSLAFYLWTQNHKRNLDWFTAYSDYLASGCNVCFQYFNNINPKEIPTLETEFNFGIIRQLTGGHINYGANTVSSQQSEKNKRIEKLISLFIEKGADINYIRKDGPGYTTLYAITQMGNPRLVDFLLNNGADPSITDTIPEKIFYLLI